MLLMFLLVQLLTLPLLKDLYLPLAAVDACPHHSQPNILPVEAEQLCN
jgi:hypothetical protein